MSFPVSEQENLPSLAVAGNNHVNDLRKLWKGILHKGLLDGKTFLKDESHFGDACFVEWMAQECFSYGLYSGRP